MKKVYTDEQMSFLYSFVPGHSCAEVADEFKRLYGRTVSQSAIKSWKNNHGVKSGTKKGKSGSKLFSPEVISFLHQNNAGKSLSEITAMINGTFGTEYTKAQIASLRGRLRLNSGLTGRFEKGHVPANKGCKGICAPGCSKTWFKKGHRPHNAAEVGEERITSDGYLKIKIAEPDLWQMKHILVWERIHGPVPEGMIISFRDGNKLNCSVENLMCISLADNVTLNRWALRSKDAAVTDTGLTLVKLKRRIRTLARRKNDGREEAD